MKAILATAALFALGQTLATDYSAAKGLRVETTSKFSMETTSSSVERDGEPVDSPFGDASSKESRTVVEIDRYLEQKDGQPTHVRRTFESIDSEGTMQFGERSMDIEREAPLEGVTLDLSVDGDGEVAVEVADGPKPEAEFLEGHRPALALDAFLPKGEVAEKDTWELDGDAIQRAFGADLEPKLFPRPEPPDTGGGEGRRGGGGGRRGFGGRGGGDSPPGFFRLGEWKGEANLESLSEDHEGTSCALIAIEIQGSGELPEMGGGGGQRGGGFAAGAPLPAAGENEFEVTAKGKLYYSLADHRPIYLEIEGKIAFERHSERSSERGSFSMTSSHEGTFTHTVEITEAKSE